MKHKFDIDDEETNILTAINRISKLLNKTPTQKEYKQNRKENELSLEQILYRYGNYGSAVSAAGLNPNPTKTPPRQPEILKDQLIDEFIRVANKINRLPANNEFRVHSKYSWTPYKTKWGSFKNAIAFIVENYAERFNFKLPKNNFRKKVDKRRKELNYTCGLIYEPNNEYETVVLFTLLSKELEYKIKLVQSDFPDAIILDKHNNEIIVEFEYMSSNYKQHGHPMDFKGMVICWRKDILLDSIEIFSLEEYIRKERNPTSAST